MSDPADKSDDLIAELAKLMAASPAGDKPSVSPVNRPVASDPVSTAAPAAAPQTPPPIRIPGMDMPRPAAPVAGAPAAPTGAAHATGAPSVAAPRAPITGAIRIPGMDNPAPVATSAPVSKFDFGARPAAAAPIKQEPLSSLTERLAAQNPSRTEPSLGPSPAPQPTPVRIPSDLRPVSENRSFAQGPTLTVTPAPSATPPVQPAAPASDFSFDFGFGRNPPASSSPPRPTDDEPEHDPIADLIAAELGDDEADAASGKSDDKSEPQQAKPSPVPPVANASTTTPAAPAKPVFPPLSAASPRPASAQPIPLKPISVAPRAPETDRFAVSPGQGISMKAPGSQPLGQPALRSTEPSSPELPDTDPMSEIESLIGEAVRVELAPPGAVKVQAVDPVAPQVRFDGDIDGDGDDDITDSALAFTAPPAPVVPPLNSQFAPRRSGLKDDSGSSSAEEAILAAAAATGAQVDRIDPPNGDESPYRRLKVKPAKSSWSSGGIRQYVGMAVAGTLLLAAGLGLYWVLNMGRGSTLATANEAPQLTADATPVKEVPAVQPAAEADTPRSPVLERIDGTPTDASAEQLVSTDETKDEIVPRDVTQVAATDTEGGLANRKVRTVTVRPDGTIVSGDDAVAGAEALPVERPNVPEVPSMSAETPNLLTDTTPAELTAPTGGDATVTASLADPLNGTATAESSIQPVFDPTVRAPTPMPVPVRTAQAAVAETPVASFAEQEPAPIALTGAQTPNGQIDLLGGTIQQPVQVAAAPAAASSSNAAAFIQLSSSPTQEAAQASVRSLNNRYGSLFGGNELVIQSADLGQKGTWYRVKLPAASLADAQSICSSIKANGGDCIVSGR